MQYVPVTADTTAYKLHVPTRPADTRHRSYTLVPEGISRSFKIVPVHSNFACQRAVFRLFREVSKGQ
jgi:hypothetical protein